MVGAVHPGRVVHGVHVYPAALQGVLDPAGLGEPEVSALPDHPATEFPAVHPQRIVGPVPDLCVALGARLDVGADAPVPEKVHLRLKQPVDELVGGERVRIRADEVLYLRRERHGLGGAGEDAAPLGDEVGIVVGPGRALQAEEALALGEAPLGVRVRVQKDVEVVEGGDEPRVRAE